MLFYVWGLTSIMSQFSTGLENTDFDIVDYSRLSRNGISQRD
jgi:hypothetical protein